MDKEENFQVRERDLHRRELELRLRELEAEVTDSQPNINQTERYENDRLPVKQKGWRGKLATATRYSGLFATGIVVLFISHWIAWISAFAFIGGAGWLWYKLRYSKEK
jgi:Flp pilus assembly protein TadB